jgi:serine/threonine protein kinase
MQGDEGVNAYGVRGMGQANPQQNQETPARDAAPRAEQGANSEPIPPALAASPDYEVVREISRGGMGVVYLARNRRMDRLEGLKVVKAALLERAGALERFEREMRAAARLSHPNIVTAYSSPPLDGLLAFAMEYVDGIDLQQLVKSRGPLPVSNACYYIYQAAQGLQHAFEQQMVHRDIKPNNLMLKRDGKRQVIKILDFGLAKATSENPIDAGLTGEGQVLGTPHYMAPEQISHASKADIRADIYSLGCTLYCLLTGAPPFGDKGSVFEILQAHISEAARQVDEVRPDIPAELAAIVARMMAKDVAQRYQKPAEVAQALAPYFKQGVKTIPTGEARIAAPSPVQAPFETASSKSAEATRLSPAAPAARNANERERLPPFLRKTTTIWAGVAVVAALLALIGLWAGGAFTASPTPVETKHDLVSAEPPPRESPVSEQPQDNDREVAADDDHESAGTPPAEAKVNAPRAADHASEPEPVVPKQPARVPVAEIPRTAERRPETVDENPADSDPEASDFQPADLLKPARTKYATDVRKAERALAAQFDREIEALARVRMKPEERVHLIESLKAEKRAFEARKLIPWSGPMRKAVLDYLKELMQADAAITKAHDRHISAAVKARDQTAVEKLRAELRAAAPRRLLGVWHCAGVTFNHAWTWKLYSDGTFDKGNTPPSPGDRWLWSLDASTFRLKARNANDPKIETTCECIIATDGALLTGELNKKERFTGRIDRSGN